MSLGKFFQWFKGSQAKVHREAVARRMTRDKTKKAKKGGDTPEATVEIDGRHYRVSTSRSGEVLAYFRFQDERGPYEFGYADGYKGRANRLAPESFEQDDPYHDPAKIRRALRWSGTPKEYKQGYRAGNLAGKDQKMWDERQ